MANGNLILAVAQGLRPPQIVGAVANLRSTVAQLTASHQLSDERVLAILLAANAIQSPNGIDITA